MAVPNPILEFVRRIEHAGLNYMVTGSVAVILYGEPRLTHDVDIVVELDSADAKKLSEAFPIATFYCPPPEVIEVEVRREQRGHFNLIQHETGFKADMYIAGNDPLHKWAMDRKRTARIGEESVVLAPPEYVILRKLEFFREGGSEKHLRDIQSILRTSGDQVDRAEIERWASKLGLVDVWKRVSA